MTKNLKKSIRKRAKKILHTYINDGYVKNKEELMKIYFKSVKYIMTYGL